MSAHPSHAAARVQRPPAEQLYADELAQLRRNDSGPVPPGWQMSMHAVQLPQ